MYFKFTYVSSVSQIHLHVQFISNLLYQIFFLDQGISKYLKPNLTNTIYFLAKCITNYFHIQCISVFLTLPMYLSNCISNNFHIHCISVPLTKPVYYNLLSNPMYLKFTLKPNKRTWDLDTYCVVEQRRLRRDCTNAHARLNLRCSHT